MSSRVRHCWWLLMLLAPIGCAQGGGPDWSAADSDLDEADGAGGEAGGASSSSSTSGSSSGTAGAGGGDGVTCAPHEKLCGGICKDVTSDANNCGDCFNVCDTDEECVNGQCPTDDPGGTGGGGTGGGNPGACAPLSPAPVCGPASRCTPQPNGTPTCVGPTGAGGQYTYCTLSSECDTIHECVNTGTYSFCLQWCTTDVDCPNWYDLCHPFDPAAYVGGQPWGFCWNGVS